MWEITLALVGKNWRFHGRTATLHSMLNSVNNNPLLMLVVGVRTCLKLYPPNVPVFSLFTVGVRTCLVLYLRTVPVSCALSWIYCRCENMYHVVSTNYIYCCNWFENMQCCTSLTAHVIELDQRDWLSHGEHPRSWCRSSQGWRLSYSNLKQAHTRTHTIIYVL